MPSDTSLTGNEWEGRVGDSWASEWVRTDRSFSELTKILIAHVLERTTETSRILDIGCGAGETTLEMAKALPKASLMGIDISPNLIAAAKARTPDHALVDFEVSDAMVWNGDDWRPDVLMSRHGVMFFDDPATAFSHFHNLAAPDAWLVFSCFRDRAENDWASKLAGLLPQPPAFSPTAPGPFAFADADRVTSILSSAGWSDVVAEPVDFTYIAGAGPNAIAEACDFFTHIGTAARGLRELSEEQRKEFFIRLDTLLRDHLRDDMVGLKAAAWIWTARA